MKSQSLAGVTDDDDISDVTTDSEHPPGVDDISAIDGGLSGVELSKSKVISVIDGSLSGVELCKSKVISVIDGSLSGVELCKS